MPNYGKIFASALLGGVGGAGESYQKMALEKLKAKDPSDFQKQYEYYKSLPPEEQASALNLKNAGTYGWRDTDHGPEKISPPKPEGRAPTAIEEYKAAKARVEGAKTNKAQPNPVDQAIVNKYEGVKSTNWNIN